MHRLFPLVCLVAIPFSSCKKPAQATAPEQAQAASTPSASPSATSVAEPAPPLLDACSLLTSEQIQSVLGEPVQTTKPSGKTEGGFQVSQCYFALPTAAKSLSLTILLKGSGPGARDPKQMWQETFHRDPDKEKGKERGEGEEREKAKPQKVDGLGDEAFWTSNAVGGVLYTLKGNSYVRVSIGGGDDPPTRQQKSRALTEMVLKRL
jgi:hypothetical protein